MMCCKTTTATTTLLLPSSYFKFYKKENVVVGQSRPKMSNNSGNPPRSPPRTRISHTEQFENYAGWNGTQRLEMLLSSHAKVESQIAIYRMQLERFGEEKQNVFLEVEKVFHTLKNHIREWNNQLSEMICKENDYRRCSGVPR